MSVRPLESVSREYMAPVFPAPSALTLTVAFSRGIAPRAVDTFTFR